MSRQKSYKRRSRFCKISAAFLLVLVAAAGYLTFQYQEGVSMADPEEQHKEYEFNGEKNLDKINVLLMGVDERPDEGRSRTDSIMVAQYDPKEGTAKVISVMRDIYTEIPGYKNYKINTAFYLGGPELLRETLKQDFDLDIEYYALIDFTGFEKMVDALAPDGIQIDVEKKMSANIGVSLEPGLQRLNGKELLGYARFRKDAEADFGRVRRQQQVINALKSELLSVNGVAKLPKLIGAAQSYIHTNLQTGELFNIMQSVTLHPPETLETLTIPIENSFSNERYEGVGLALNIDFVKNKEAIHSFLKGDQSKEPVQFSLESEEA
ncbi:LCP family protein [Cytobacillus solani]|uniref:Regulatory protein MsrR n=1 Tax=Cytobacillus solani TaxID=1637975 RepID=A0A0Q3QK27_9BACI|nr:LCP family protein [Cytobacillus solani]KOP81228.1 transcriptional regulator [Bacillus sp. FJAT-21945]KQL18241.1 transcriptional regulator [Cytobacillus solani]